MKRCYEYGGPGSGSHASKRSRPGFSSVTNIVKFEERYGKLSGNFPFCDYTFVDERAEHAAERVPELTLPVQTALLQLASMPATLFRSLIYTGRSEKPLYYLVYLLLASLRHGSLIISADGLEEEEEDCDDEDEDPEDPDYEDDVGGTSKRPAELVVLRAKSHNARATAMSSGVRVGVAAGCEAAMVVVPKASVVFNDIWQALAAGVELARGNRDAGAAGAVAVVLTDAMKWYFFSVEAVIGPDPGLQRAPAGGSGQQAGAAGGAEAGAGGRQGAGAARGLEFTLGSGDAVETFRLRRCDKIYADMTSSAHSPAVPVVEVMYRLYTALYPDQDISELPGIVREAEAQTRADADGWLERKVEALRRAKRAPEDAVADFMRRRLEEERRAREKAEAEVAELRAKLAAVMEGRGEGAGRKP